MSSEPQHPGPEAVAPRTDRDDPRDRRDGPAAGDPRDRRDGPHPDEARDRRDGPGPGETPERRDDPHPGGTPDRRGEPGAAAGDRPRGGRLSEDRPENRRDDEHHDAGLIDPERARGYRSRWETLKGDFVDEPRRAVRDANALVGEVLDDLEATFRNQREHLERDLDSSQLSTEDMRLALGRYRTFFDRLLDL